MNEQAQPKIHVPPILPQQELKRSPTGGKQRQMILITVLSFVVIGVGAAYFFFFTNNTDTNKKATVAEQTNTTQPTENKTAQDLATNGEKTNAGTNEKTITFNLDEATEGSANTNVDITTNQNVNAVTTNTNMNVEIGFNTNTMSTDTNTATNINSDLTLGLGDSTDTDNDNVPNNIEFWYGTNSKESDTDGDAYDDYTEIVGCYDPNGNGRIELDHFTHYCVASLISQGIEHEVGSQFLLTEYCDVWSMEAMILIEEAAISNDVNQAWMDMNQVGFDSLCDDMNDIDSGEAPINLDELCFAMQMMLAGFCNPTHW